MRYSSVLIGVCLLLPLPLQVVASSTDTAGFDNTAQCGGVGACVAVLGKIVTSPGKGQAIELQALRSNVLGFVDTESYPMAKKQHNLEFLRAQVVGLCVGGKKLLFLNV